MASCRKNTLKAPWRRASAMLICLALLYFAGGGSFLHQHHGAPDTVCHVCQSLHAPALTVAFSGIASAPQISGWHDSRPVVIAALDEFSVLRSGRAPPSA
jgi:hypothetical protein